MKTIIFALLLVIGTVAFYVLKNRTANNQKAHTTKRPLPDPSAASRFHAVSIRFGSKACQAASELQGKRFLSNAAPRLPLPECNVHECECRFAHHKDRREEEDRRSPIKSTIGVFEEPREQQARNAKDRRDSPPDEF